MIWIIVALGLIIAGETWFFFTGFRDHIDPTKEEIMDEYWLEFIDWIQDARIVRRLAPPYDVYVDVKTNSTPQSVAFINENNFWLWYAEVKWNKKDATERTKKRATRKSSL